MKHGQPNQRQIGTAATMLMVSLVLCALYSAVAIPLALAEEPLPPPMELTTIHNDLELQPYSPVEWEHYIAAGGVPLPQPGSARPWQGEIGVATYSSVNLDNGNLLTVLPLEGLAWSGRGPGVSFAFFHNSADGLWRHSYSTHLQFDSATQIRLIGDDGAAVKFTESAGVWDAEAGFHMQLAPDGSNWRVTFTDQSVTLFDSAGRLVSLADAAGNAVTLQRDSQHDFRISSITDAPGRVLNFHYDAGDRLDYVEEGFETEDEDQVPVNRRWSFGYDANGRLNQVTDPMAHHIDVTLYDTASRIRFLADKNGDAFEYQYDSSGRCKKVLDPAPYAGQTQKFQYNGIVMVDPWGTTPVLPLPSNTTIYTDRRNSQWVYYFQGNSARKLYKAANPYGQAQRVQYDADNNVIYSWNPLNKMWSYTYDGRGNLLSVTDPVGTTPDVVYTYDTLNNLHSVTDADGNSTVMYYEVPAIDPTAVTTVTLPPAQPGGDPGLVALQYYDDTTSWDGLLRSVTDPNSVTTLYEYDATGQPMTLLEGAIDIVGEGWKVVVESYEFDQASRLLSSERTLGLLSEDGRSGNGGRQVASRNLTICCHGCAGRSRYFLNGWYARSNCMMCTCACTLIEEGPRGGSGGRGLGFDGGGERFISSDPWPAYTQFGELSGEGEASYDPMGRLLNATGGREDSYTGENGEVTLDQIYDELGRLRSTSQSSQEATWQASGTPVVRGYTYTPDWTTGVFERTGPDGQLTRIETDLAGRVTHVERHSPVGTLSADYTYTTAGQLQSVTYGNGTQTVYTYYDNEQLHTITHKQSSTGPVLLGLEYVYDDRGLIDLVAESDDLGTVAMIDYEYDNRGRLTGEVRTGTHEYDYSYTYDQGGNRLTKTAVSGQPAVVSETVYHYDLENPEFYKHKNNRLMSYEVTVDGVPAEEVEYRYSNMKAGVGNPTRMIRKPAGSPDWQVTELAYNKQGELQYITDKTWTTDGAGEVLNETIENIQEFRGQGRARYLTRSWDTQSLSPDFDSALWTDYDGDEPYADYTVDELGSVTVTKIFEPGLGEVDQLTGEITYFHTDHLGTTRAVSDQQAAVSQTAVYTSFGEKIDDPLETRYGYVGAYGYESFSELTPSDFPLTTRLQHVGHRTYDPALGRFLERDPIGILGGLNVYEYVSSMATMLIDPKGFGGCCPEPKWQHEGRYPSYDDYIPHHPIEPEYSDTVYTDCYLQIGTNPQYNCKIGQKVEIGTDTFFRKLFGLFPRIDPDDPQYWYNPGDCDEEYGDTPGYRFIPGVDQFNEDWEPEFELPP
ncbi:MAG: hypothetical protein HJJLKODD_01368 [Phycisphaerae bacterium]|nr:hypothetical protein [Phycisphaerae bacterium]